MPGPGGKIWLPVAQSLPTHSLPFPLLSISKRLPAVWEARSLCSFIGLFCSECPVRYPLPSPHHILFLLQNQFCVIFSPRISSDLFSGPSRSFYYFPQHFCLCTPPRLYNVLCSLLYALRYDLHIVQCSAINSVVQFDTKNIKSQNISFTTENSCIHFQSTLSPSSSQSYHKLMLLISE